MLVSLPSREKKLFRQIFFAAAIYTHSSLFIDTVDVVSPIHTRASLNVSFFSRINGPLLVLYKQRLGGSRFHMLAFFDIERCITCRQALGGELVHAWSPLQHSSSNKHRPHTFRSVVPPVVESVPPSIPKTAIMTNNKLHATEHSECEASLKVLPDI